MLSINALSLAPDVRAWLANLRSPRILHIFDQACNLIDEHGDVLSVVTPQVGNGPFNIVLDKDICFSKHLSLKSPVSLSYTHLNLGDLAINTAGANHWNPRPDWERLHSNKDKILEQLQITSYLKNDLDTPSATVSGYSTITRFQSLIPNFSSALVGANTSTVKAVASQLAGLGQGLTPSGDDFLIGAIYATWILHPPEAADALTKEIVKVAAPLTTSLSAAWLRSAGKEQAGILWHEFFDALLTGEGIELPMVKLLSVGETSGADALAGFFAMFSAYNERIIINQCPS